MTPSFQGAAIAQIAVSGNRTPGDCQAIALTFNTTSRKCLGFRSPVEAFLEELGTNVSLRFNPESTGSLMGDTAPGMVLAFVLKFISK